MKKSPVPRFPAATEGLRESKIIEEFDRTSSLSDLETDFSSKTLSPDPAAHKNQDFLTLPGSHAAMDPIQHCFEPRSVLFSLFSPLPPEF
jgi:hypothetical protein